MKVGLSYSRCVRDIINGDIHFNEVLIIISGTDFDPNNDEHWKSIWEGYRTGTYSHPEWHSYPNEMEQAFRDVSIELYDSGKLHQPRQFGNGRNRAGVSRAKSHWLDVVDVESK